MTDRSESIKRGFEPRIRRCPVTPKSLVVSIAWTVVAAAGSVLALWMLSGCVSLGYANRRIEIARQDLKVCQEELGHEERLSDDLKAQERLKENPAPRRPPKVNIEWDKK